MLYGKYQQNPVVINTLIIVIQSVYLLTHMYLFMSYLLPNKFYIYLSFCIIVKIIYICQKISL